MHMRTILPSGLLLLMSIAGIIPAANPQSRRNATPPPRIDVLNCNIEANLTPDTHEFKAAAIITFKPLESTDSVVLELSENVWVQKVLNSEGVELQFGQDEIGPGYLSVHFSKPLALETSVTIRVEYDGGFDRDRFSRMYSRDDSSAYIGMEGTYLMYSAKWFPVNDYLVDRASGTLQVTVPLGMTVIGPGTQMPVVTKGIYETFGWQAGVPILPGSFVAGRYFRKKMQFGGITIDCFARENNLDSMQSSAEAMAKILEYYNKTYGSSASGKHYRLVEVDDQLAKQPGMLGTVFITRRELDLPTPPVRDLARRIAYQWWQETVGVSSPSDLWLVDGMAYYSAAQYLGNIEGPAALKKEIDNLAVLALKFENKSAVRDGYQLGYRTDRYESVVAGKGAWILNMLRGILGDSKFNQLIQQYIQKYSGKECSTAEFEKLAESLNGKKLGWFFTEWVDTIGVPDLQVDYVIYKTYNGFRVSGTIDQDQDLFRMPLEIGVGINGEEETKTVELNGKSTPFDIVSFSMPDKVIVDPNDKILRDSKELQTSAKISLGDDLAQSKSYVEAIRAYEAALKLSPHNSLAHFRLAEVFYDQFNLQSAANSFRDALNGNRDPKWIEVWCYIYLGKIYDILGQRQRAMAEYTKAINTKDDTNGAQAEANKWLKTPFTRERTTMQVDNN